MQAQTHENSNNNKKKKKQNTRTRKQQKHQIKMSLFMSNHKEFLFMSNKGYAKQYRKNKIKEMMLFFVFNMWFDCLC